MILRIRKVVAVAALFVAMTVSVTGQDYYGEVFDRSFFIGTWAADGTIFTYDTDADLGMTEWVFPLQYVFFADGTGYRTEGDTDYPFDWSVMFRRDDESRIGAILTFTEGDSVKVSFVGFAGPDIFAEATILRDGEPDTPFHYMYHRVK